MSNTDDISKEVINAMHVLAAAMDHQKVESGNTSFYVDFNKEELVYENHASGRTIRANVCGDSEMGSIIDYARVILLRGQTW